jgi:glycosyltransferase involved in cell wall biosynthesis
MNDADVDRAKQTRLIENALSAGQAALAAGDRIAATRWLDRARRLAPNDITVRLVLAAAAIGEDNATAADLFARVLKEADTWDAWLGLASARFLMGELNAARAALTAALSRHVARPGVAGLADRVAWASGAPGWCGLTGEGAVLVYPTTEQRIVAAIDGKPVDTDAMPRTWPRRRCLTVMAGDRHLIGSPISLRAIGRVEGHVEADRDGIRGWAWCPADSDHEPRLWVGNRRDGTEVVASAFADWISGLAPLARPRAFAVAWRELADGDAEIRVRGRDGRALRGGPIARSGIRIASPPARASRRSAPKQWPQKDWPAKDWHDDGRDAVILITHDDGGGVERRVQAAIAAHTARGRRAIVLRPARPPDNAILVSATGSPVLRFELPRRQSAMLRLLRAAGPVETELHHFINHDPSVFEIARVLGIPYDVHVHDYTWFCQRIALVGRRDRYCGEPAPAGCETCVAKLGSYLHEHISVAALLERSRRVLGQARRVIAPSADAAARISRHFVGIDPEVIPHEDDDAIDDPPPIPLVNGTVLVCVAGGIGLHKGYRVLLACARDARKRALDLNFVVVGATIDDQSLIDTGRVFVTGPYQPDEAVGLIRQQGATLALLPSIWPETWCLGLGELWRAGLRVAAFDIGAPAERIRRTGRGFLMPLDLAPPSINNALLNAAKGTSSLPIRRSSAYKVPINATVSK